MIASKAHFNYKPPLFKNRAFCYTLIFSQLNLSVQITPGLKISVIKDKNKTFNIVLNFFSLSVTGHKTKQL